MTQRKAKAGKQSGSKSYGTGCVSFHPSREAIQQKNRQKLLTA
jgi:hypothetical protein